MRSSRGVKAGWTNATSPRAAVFQPNELAAFALKVAPAAAVDQTQLHDLSDFLLLEIRERAVPFAHLPQGVACVNDAG